MQSPSFALKREKKKKFQNISSAKATRFHAVALFAQKTACVVQRFARGLKKNMHGNKIQPTDFSKLFSVHFAFFSTIKLKYPPFSWQRNRGTTLTLYPQASSWPYFKLLMSCHCVIFMLQPQHSGQPHSCPRTCPKQGSKSEVIKLCACTTAPKNSTLDRRPNVSNHLPPPTPRFYGLPLSCFSQCSMRFHILCCAQCVVVSGYFSMRVAPTCFFYGRHK